MGKKIFIFTHLNIKLIAFFICLSAQSQIKISGVVKDSITQEALAYSTIGLKQSKLGVIADKNGFFEIILPEKVKRDTLILSHLGYKTTKLPASKPIINQVFFMQSGAIGLDEITLYQYGKNKIELGSDNAHHRIAYAFTNDSLKGSEIGKRILVENPVLLKDITFFVKENTFKSVKLRVHFYNLDNSNNQYQPSNKVDLDKYIIADVTKKRGRVKLDLSDFNITFNDHFMVAIETIDFKGEGQFILRGEWHSPKAQYKGISGFSKLEKDNVFVTGYIQSGFFKRSHNQDSWVEIRPHNLAIKINALKAETN